MFAVFGKDELRWDDNCLVTWPRVWVAAPGARVTVLCMTRSSPGPPPGSHISPDTSVPRRIIMRNTQGEWVEIYSVLSCYDPLYTDRMTQVARTILNLSSFLISSQWCNCTCFVLTPSMRVRPVWPQEWDRPGKPGQSEHSHQSIEIVRHRYIQMSCWTNLNQFGMQRIMALVVLDMDRIVISQSELYPGHGSLFNDVW